MRIIGIDPGVNGAIGIITESGAFIDAFDMPTVVANKSSNRQMVDAYTLGALLRQQLTDAQGALIAVIEHVQPMPSQRVRQSDGERVSMPAAYAFAFGDSVGAIRGVVAALGISIERVTPQRWKKHFGLAKEKEQARELALRTWPAANERLRLKGHHNRAEALLLARWYAHVQKPVMLGDIPAAAVPF